MFAPRHALKLRPPCLGDADRVRLRESVNSREVRHSQTWYSSESESALKRFESVAMVMLQLDGRGALFAPVAARRQKEFKRGKHSSFCPFRSFRTSEKNTMRKVSFNTFHHAKARETQGFFAVSLPKNNIKSPFSLFRYRLYRYMQY